MFVPFLLAVWMVFVAEMGDKTQLLAMAFSARYRWLTVLCAVAAATAANHLLAVIAGNMITRVIPPDVIQLVAAIGFLIFALWTLHDDTSPEAQERAGASPFWTVAIAFFIAEMGDKTQLATMNLAASEAAREGAAGFAGWLRQIVPIWCGTTVGMILADGVGILAGAVLHRSMPTRVVKWIAAATFAIFGLLGMHKSLDVLLPKGTTAHHVALLSLIPVMALLMALIARRSARRTALRREGISG